MCSSKQQGVGKSITVGCLCAAQSIRETQSACCLDHGDDSSNDNIDKILVGPQLGGSYQH